MHDLLGRQEVQHLVDNLAKVAPKVVEELVPGVMTVGSIQQVLAHLLREQVSIRDLRSVLEVLADWAPTVKSPERLAEFVRRKFARVITGKFVTPDGVLPLVSLTPTLERMLNDALQQTDEGSFLALEPSNAQLLINKLARAAEKFGEIGQTPVLLAPGHLRPAVFNFVDRFAPGYAVLSHYEIAPNTKVQSLGVLNIGE
jgi:flagellar biosynthesis protein FlhA